jgi:hypothetical protein
MSREFALEEWTQARVRYVKSTHARRCVRCHSKHADSGVHCSDCRVKNRNRMARLRAARKSMR